MLRPITCRHKAVPDHKVQQAGERAVEENPVNHAPLERLVALRPGFKPTKQDIALLRTRYWGSGRVHLTVRFLDNPNVELRARILQNMNAWNQQANVAFVETTEHKAQVRIARTPGDGYWSYVGTDILAIDDFDQPTMNLDSFSMETPESEFHRVVRHEAGHTLGFVHEHMRSSLVAKIDVAKAIAYFGATQGWSEDEVRLQVLTPIEESSLRGTMPDPDSIMCYQIPGEITVDGEPILGGTDIDPIDYAFAGKMYPKSATAAADAPPAQRGSVPIVFLTSSDPAYVAAVVAATRGL